MGIIFILCLSPQYELLLPAVIYPRWTKMTGTGLFQPAGLLAACRNDDSLGDSVAADLL